MFKNRNGLASAKAAHPLEVLGSFLEDDLQGGSEASQNLLQLISDVRANVIPFWESTGNAHTLTLTPETAHIHNEFASPTAECEVPINDFQDVIEQWLEFVMELDS